MEWLELAEYPSGFLNVNEIQDDFEFKPFRLLFNRMILPWFLKETWEWALKRSPYAADLRGLSPWARSGVRSEWKEALRAAHTALVNRETSLDPYLCQFWFAESPPDEANLDDFWRTINQRGIYKLTENMPPLSTKTLSFRIEDASYLKRDGTDWLRWHVDALFPKYGIINTMSWYLAADMPNTEMVTPNPLHSQLVSSQPIRPDLFTATCFFDADVPKLRRLFLGPSPRNPWTLLDSIDIEPIWNPRLSQYGVSVRVRNCGGTFATNSRLHVWSFFMLFTGEQEIQPSPSFRLSPTPTAVSGGTRRIGRIDPGQIKTCKIRYRRVCLLSDINKIITNELNKVKHAVMINVVNITRAEDELMLGNNKAIEIVQVMRE